MSVALTSAEMPNPWGLWIAGYICYVFFGVDSEYVVKNIKKWPLGLTHAAFCRKNGLILLQIAADLKVLNESILYLYTM